MAVIRRAAAGRTAHVYIIVIIRGSRSFFILDFPFAAMREQLCCWRAIIYTKCRWERARLCKYRRAFFFCESANFHCSWKLFASQLARERFRGEKFQSHPGRLIIKFWNSPAACLPLNFDGNFWHQIFLRTLWCSSYLHTGEAVYIYMHSILR